MTNWKDLIKFEPERTVDWGTPEGYLEYNKRLQQFLNDFDFAELLMLKSFILSSAHDLEKEFDAVFAHLQELKRLG